MFIQYAVTLICALFPCTQVADTPTSVNIELDLSQPPSYNSFLLLPEDFEIHVSPKFPNVSSSFVAVHSSSSVSEVQSDFPPKEEEFQADLDAEYPIVKTKNGLLKGFTMRTIGNRSISAWKGIPFAQPPLGDLRFEAPVKASPWSGIRDAMADSPTCIQADFLQQYKIHGEEDCLYSSVYAPKGIGRESLLPVVVWIHGGGWFFSTSSLYGPAYLLDQDVVLVTFNYRLSAFGFLATGDTVSPGNNGFKDQVLALKWVQENIMAFGGDPNRVTIFGESAGASAVHFHMVSPLSRGLFHGGISQSGCSTCFWSISEKAPELTKKYASLLNCTGTSSEIVACLRTKDASQLVATQLAFLEWTMYPVVIFGPVLEPENPTAFLTELPERIYERGESAPVPWISGFNKDEGGINIAILFLGNGSLDQVNLEWGKYGPIFLDLKNTEPNYQQVSEKVRQHYLGEEKINFSNRGDVVKMFGDRYVVNCGVKAIQLHAKYNPAPVYAYHLGYQGKYSIVQLLGQKAQDWGVSHLDDLIYLFNNTAYYPELSVTDEEYKVSKMMTGIWANFAATGKPLIPVPVTDAAQTNQVIRPTTWKPVSKESTFTTPVEYLDIGVSPKMIQDPFYERVKFWRDLELQDP